MLVQLNINGLVLIDSLSVEFGDGFNVITGETGAGKSILIKALGFVLGGKASPDFVRQGSSKACVVATFRLPVQHKFYHYLNSLGLEFEPSEGLDSDLVIRRQMTDKGRSSSWIQDIPVSTQALRGGAELLLDVFSQHEHHSLLSPSRHIDYLDQFIAEKEKYLLSDYQELFLELKEKVSDFSDLCENLNKAVLEKDYLEFRHQQFADLAPLVEDYEALKETCELASEHLANQTLLLEVGSIFDPSGEEMGVAEQVRMVARYLVKARPMSLFAELAVRSEALASELDDISFELARLQDGDELDPRSIDLAQQRLASYQDLMRRTGSQTIDDLVGEHTRLAQELGKIDLAQDRFIMALDQLEKNLAKLIVAADQLSKARKKASKALSKFLGKELNDLDMKGAAIEVEFNSVNRNLDDFIFPQMFEDLKCRWTQFLETYLKHGEKGREKVQFLLSSNHGESTQPLHKIASGGEISRIMLAIKRCLAAGADSCLLVFDEIDVGISGRVADVVGQKMRDLSERFQILCISHLPQVAVYCETHLLVSKKRSSDGKRTISNLEVLSRDESTREIARMLSGTEVTVASLANAKSLRSKVENQI